MRFSHLPLKVVSCVPLSAARMVNFVFWMNALQNKNLKVDDENDESCNRNDDK